MAVEDKTEDPGFELKQNITPLPKSIKRLGADGNIYGNLYQVMVYSEKLGEEIMYIFSKDYNKPIFEKVTPKENR